MIPRSIRPSVIRKPPRRWLREQHGTAAVEFALLMSILLMLLLGIFDFGRVFDAWLVATNAAREGARYGAIYGADPDLSTADVVSNATSKVNALFVPGTGEFGSRTDIGVGTVSVQFPSGRKIGQPVEATVTVQVQLGPYIRDLIFNGNPSITVTGKATMRI